MSQHVLAFIDGSAGSDAVVATAQQLVTASDVTLTLVAVAVVEDERRGCCDLRSGLWNRMQRELAAEQLREAETRMAVRVHSTVAEGPTVEAALADECHAGEYDLIVVADDRRLLPWKARLADRLRARAGCEVRTPNGC